MAVHVLGIRHHGPGSSRHVLHALNSIRPDIVMVEGPPEGNALISWMNHAEMKPPVALLAYVQDSPQQAVYYPFAIYSPELMAVQWALENKVQVQFVDMPLANKFAIKSEENQNVDVEEAEDESDEGVFQYMAIADGFGDVDTWWEARFERSNDSENVFKAIIDAISVVREGSSNEKKEILIREAFMRKAIRQAQREMYAEIVFVCGAWHAPALLDMPKQKVDDELTRQLPKVKVDCTWIPWTNQRLTKQSGYGAGIQSPGWYEYLWKLPEDNGIYWLAKTAEVFRSNKMDISSAHVLEAFRLVQSLTNIRSLSQPGLAEMSDATQSVMCFGEEIMLSLVQRELIVGKSIGEVPSTIPQTPLQSNFDQLLKSFRLKISDQGKRITLDIREQNDLNKSVFFHRLLILQINWPTQGVARSKGTFKEEWSLYWEPEMSVALVEKAAWGNTIEAAASAYLQSIVEQSQDLSTNALLLEKAIAAELHETIQACLKRIDDLAAGNADIIILSETVIPLFNILRYGNVRNTNKEQVQWVVDALFARMLIQLPMSVSSLNDEQAQKLSDNILKVNDAIRTLSDESLINNWLENLIKLMEIDSIAPQIHGMCCKILYDSDAFTEDNIMLYISRFVSRTIEPMKSAAWLESFLKDGAMALLLDEKLWSVIFHWVDELNEENFVTTLPVLRRTFSTFQAAEKRKIAEKIKEKPNEVSLKASNENYDMARVEKILPAIMNILQI